MSLLSDHLSGGIPEQLSPILPCAELMWRFQLGDPDLGGLVLTALYFLIDLLFLRIILTRKDWIPGERFLWAACTVIVTLLTINKQLDLQHFISNVGHCVAQSEGWYAHRQAFQHGSAVTLLVISSGVILTIGWASKNALRRSWRLLLGMVLLLVYVSLQVARFEHVASRTIDHDIIALALHRVIETMALLVLLWAVIQGRSWSRR